MWSSPSLHIYIKNASTFGRTLTEHLLNAGTRPQTCKRARVSPRNWVGQKEKIKKKSGQSLCHWEGRKAVKEEEFLHREVPLLVGRSARTRGTLKPLKKAQ